MFVATPACRRCETFRANITEACTPRNCTRTLAMLPLSCNIHIHSNSILPLHGLLGNCPMFSHLVVHAPLSVKIRILPITRNDMVLVVDSSDRMTLLVLSCLGTYAGNWIAAIGACTAECRFLVSYYCSAGKGQCDPEQKAGELLQTVTVLGRLVRRLGRLRCRISGDEYARSGRLLG